MKTLFAAGMSYKTAPVEVRERLAVGQAHLGCSACRLKIGAGLAEVVLLSTCNRVEIYGVASGIVPSAEALFRWLNPEAANIDLTPHLYHHTGSDAARHLFTVTGGMDSMVLGETEITGQVKNAYQSAADRKLTGKVLNRLFQKALQTAKSIRTQTQVGKGATSVGSAAVELAEKIFGESFAQQTIMIVGAGKMGEACVRHLAKRGAKTVLVSNRSIEKAEALAADIGGRALSFDDCINAMVETDIVVCSTGCPQIVLHRHQIESVMRSRRQRPLVLIDIAVPRNIDPEAASLGNVYLHDIDDLEALVRENVRQREHELARCRSIVEEQTAEIIAKLSEQPAARRKESVLFGKNWQYGAVACPA